MYEFGDWSACSATCTKLGKDTPYKTRRINPDKIINARGKFADLAPCPANLEHLEVRSFGLLFA